MSSSSNREPTSSGSREGGRCASVDQKRRRRMESNRESARRSRLRKQQHLDDLIKQVAKLQIENEELAKKIGDFTDNYATAEERNAMLRAEKARLAARLESLECVIEIANAVVGGGSPLDNINSTYEASAGGGGLTMKPWELPCPSVPISAASGLFQF